jgi:hypothetical protein
MEKDFNIISDNLRERKIALEHYSEETLPIKKGLRSAIEYFGCRCMLGGELKRKNSITLHHIIPKGIGAKTNIKNSALLSRSKHQDLNSLGNHFPELGLNIDAYLFLYRGDCFDETVLNIINEIMRLASKQSVATEMLDVLRYNANINALIQNHEEKPYYKSNFSVNIPSTLDQTFPVLKEHFSNLYAELYTYIEKYGFEDCDIEVASRINRILQLAYYQSCLINEALPLMDKKIDTLEEYKQEITTETNRLILIKNMKKGSIGNN